MGKKIIGVVLLLLTLSAIVFVFYLAGGTEALVAWGNCHRNHSASLDKHMLVDQ